MSYDDTIVYVAQDALRYVRKGDVIGLGSGRAAAALVEELGRVAGELRIRGVPTSLQIRLAAEKAGIPMLEPGEMPRLDSIFDGADQIDSAGYMVKGGGGALLRERVLAGMAGRVVIMADETKFVERLSRPIPVEVHPAARGLIHERVSGMGAVPRLRTLERGYPAFTENGNIILDCDFGGIVDPPGLAARLRGLPGVLEAGIFERPDIIYKAAKDGAFEVIHPLG
ncbi:MAG: ribose 5-phosphate isomerase A [Thaumarchaeota archaeon]|nr:ribose 5-phosphate isomerase A [Nitrososphaerota archaeon]